MTTITELRTEAEAAWQQMWIDPDMETITFIRGAVIACKQQNQSFHLLLAAKPGSGKTTLLSGFDLIPWTHTVDSYSENTFFSGYKNGSAVDTKASLVTKLQDAKKSCVINNDFSVVMNNWKTREKVLTDIRSVIDGRRSDQKGVGSTLQEGGVTFTDENGSIAFISALTPSSLTRWDKDGYQRSLGERSLVWRMEERTSDYDPMAILNRSTDENMAKVKESEKALCLKLQEEPLPSEERSPDFVHFCKYAADFLAKARTPVITDSKAHKFESVDDTEDPIRIFKMMVSLADGYVLSYGLDYSHEKVRSVIRKICLDSIPIERNWILNRLKDSSQTTPLPHLIRESKFPERKIRNEVENLELIGLVEINKSSSYTVKASEECWDYFSKLDYLN